MDTNQKNQTTKLDNKTSWPKKQKTKLAGPRNDPLVPRLWRDPKSPRHEAMMIEDETWGRNYLPSGRKVFRHFNNWYSHIGGTG